MTESLTVFLAAKNATYLDVEGVLEEAFEGLEGDLFGVGEVVGWDSHRDGVHLYLLAETPAVVVDALVGCLRSLGIDPPWKLVAAHPATGETFYETDLG